MKPKCQGQCQGSKETIKKCEFARAEVYLALLEHRHTSSSENDRSPHNVYLLYVCKHLLYDYYSFLIDLSLITPLIILQQTDST